MVKANAAQVLSGFLWEPGNDLPKKVLTGSLEKGFEFDQTVVLEYLMKFQEFLYKGQPKEDGGDNTT